MYQLQGKYRMWAKSANFESKLPGDVTARKKKAEQAQRTLNASLVEKKLTKKVVPFRSAVQDSSHPVARSDGSGMSP